ncbi:MAG: aminoacyl-tRNA hydrolase [Desulfobacterales bacterium]|nr:aminoacyl-tRNA hydrolase [Desulfobacterales bacterium]
MFLIAGLGNPGVKYEKTRHNIGFMVIDKLSNTFDILINKNKFDGVIGKGKIKKEEVLLFKPMAFMNLSGIPVLRIMNYYDISVENVVIVHDDIDLDFGKLKIKMKGGHAGHNGLKSIINELGKDDFPRVRVGIGRSESEGNVVSHVLNSFSKKEDKHIEQLISSAEDAVIDIIEYGCSHTMNKFNNKNVIYDNLNGGEKNGCSYNG